MSADKPTVHLVYDIESTDGSIYDGEPIGFGAALARPEEVKFVQDSEGNYTLDVNSFLQDAFSVWLQDSMPEEGFGGDPDTLNWLKDPKGGALVREMQTEFGIPRQEAIDRLATWFDEVNEKFRIRLAAGPASFDHPWLKILFQRGGHKNVSKKIIRHKSTCISTLRDSLTERLQKLMLRELPLEAAKLGKRGLETFTGKVVEKLLNPTDLPHTHDPKDDATEAAVQLCLMKRFSGDVKIASSDEFYMEYPDVQEGVKIKIVYNVSTGKVTCVPY
jgi:hypothetical protein